MEFQFKVHQYQTEEILLYIARSRRGIYSVSIKAARRAG